MVCSLLIIASTTGDANPFGHSPFFTHYVKSQMHRFVIGWIAFLFFAGLDYHKLREWTWIGYLAIIILLVAVFFTPAIGHTHRWFKIPGLGFGFQPSEYAKLIIVLTLSWFLERKGRDVSRISTACQAGLIVGIPFLLILKQPDLGSALTLFPMTLVMFYFAGVHRRIVRLMSALAITCMVFVTMFFLGIVSHEEAKPLATKVLKEYQYERFNPETYHQKASKTSIALGRWAGSGWRKSEFASRSFLPAGHTDSVFPAFVEEFGLVGAVGLLLLFFGLIYCGFQVTAVARDRFGRVLSAGVVSYLAIHVVINVGMMCGLLPITGVPLILVSYGGCSLHMTMIALGILQSVYARRFMF